MTRTFRTVLRSPADFYVLPADIFGVALGGAPATEVLLRTMWRDAGLEHQLPAHLWVEVRGPGADEDAAVRDHYAVAQGIVFFASFACNAFADPLELELAYETTPGLTSRPFRQIHVRAPLGLPRGGRIVNVARLKDCFDRYLAANPSERLKRAIFQYNLALRSWRIGTEFQTRIFRSALVGAV